MFSLFQFNFLTKCKIPYDLSKLEWIIKKTVMFIILYLVLFFRNDDTFVAPYPWRLFWLWPFIWQTVLSTREGQQLDYQTDSPTRTWRINCYANLSCKHSYSCCFAETDPVLHFSNKTHFVFQMLHTKNFRDETSVNMYKKILLNVVTIQHWKIVIKFKELSPIARAAFL